MCESFGPVEKVRTGFNFMTRAVNSLIFDPFLNDEGKNAYMALMGIGVKAVDNMPANARRT